MRLFKYFQANEWTVATLLSSEFYFAKFNELNDPYELAIAGLTEEELMKIHFRFMDPRGPNGIFCLSETEFNLHMWTQYADGHKGIVVEFETDEDPVFFKELVKVNYSATPPIFYYEMTAKEVFCCKGLDSDKELEWRVFGGAGLRKMNPNAIKSISLGHRFPLGCSRTSHPPAYIQEVYSVEKLKWFIEIDKLFYENLLPEHVDFYHKRIEYGTYNFKPSQKFDKIPR